MGRTSKSLKDQRFGALYVLALKSRNAHGNSRWKCICDCGNECEVMYQNLKLGRSKSCGCGIEPVVDDAEK